MSKKNLKPINDDTKVTLNEVVGASTDPSKDDDKVPTPSGSQDANNVSKVKEETMPKQVFNTSKVASLVGAGVDSGAVSSSAASALRAISFGGDAGQIQGDKSATTSENAPRKSGDRPGRTMDTALQQLDDRPAETYTVPIKTIPNIRDGQSAVGYNGNYSNVHAVTQKGSGGSPASKKFFRTLDLMTYDNAYFAEGQYNEEKPDVLSVYSYDEDDDEYESTPRTTTTGNYLIRKLYVTMDNNANIVGFEFGVENLDDYRSGVSEDENRLAGDAALRNRNIAEADRLNMVNEAGDESKDNWSPLGKVIRSATDANRWMKEIDAMNGDLAYLSATKLSHALAYQVNKAAKDGMRKVGPMFEMCLGNVDHGTVRHGSSAETDATHLFSGIYKYYMAIGGSNLWIDMHDTTTKYTSKAKLLSMPLTFKTALATFKKNKQSFMMHDNFLKEFERQEVFGKVDEDGSGITPYFLSDGAGLIFPININDTFKFENGEISDTFTLHYEDLRNQYNMPISNFFVKGLFDWFKRNAGRIVKSLTKNGAHYTKAELGLTQDSDYKVMYPGDDTVRLTIPVTSTTTSISLWDLVVCDAAKDIAIQRTYGFDPVIRYQALNGHYPYSGVCEVGEIGSLPNIGFTDISSPLASRPIPLTVASRIILPEVFLPKRNYVKDMSKLIGGNLSIVDVIMPWYFNQNGFTAINSPLSTDNSMIWTLKAGDGSHMTTFDTRGGISFSNMDRIIAMDPEQLRLSMDRMVNIPCNNAIHGTGGESDAGAVTYKYDTTDDGMLVCTYAAYRISGTLTKKYNIFSIGGLMATPRELGLSFIAPAGIITPAYDGTDQNYRDLQSSYFRFSGPSFRCTYWHAATTVSSKLFEDHISRIGGANFEQTYDVIEATPDRGSADIGISLSASINNTSVLESVIHPFRSVVGDTVWQSDGTYDYGEDPYTGLQLNTTIKYLYTRINLLPFIINPFDSMNGIIYTTETSGGQYINTWDDYDMLHIYNVCGFRDGEYSGTEYDRIRDRVELGLGYVSDPYMERRL